METKICTTCNQKKLLTEFGKGQYKCKSCFKEYYSKNKNKIQSNNKNYYLNNKEYYLSYFKSYNKKYFVENRKKHYEYYKGKYNKEYRIKNKEIFRWRDLLITSLKSTNQSKNTTTYNLLGYTSKQLKEHLDKQGMDWDKHDIDHKVPMSWFKQNTPPHLVNALVNLQPLTPLKNRKKLNKFCSPTPKSYIVKINPWIKEQYLSMLIVE